MASTRTGFVFVAKAKRQAFPAWSGTTVDGTGWSTKQLSGTITVVNFWASWCSSCKQEWKEVQAAAAASPKVAFLGVNTMDTLDGVQAFLAANPSKYLHVFDERGVMMASYKGIPHGVMPTTLILDRRARIAAWFAGPLTRVQLSRAVKSVLATG